MVRFLAVLLFFGLAFASGAVGYFSHLQQLEKPAEEETPPEYTSISVAEILKDRPVEDLPIELSGYFFARLPVGLNLDEDTKDWEEAYIPLFSNEDRERRHNTVCVIYCTDEVKSLDDVESFYEQQSLKGFYICDQQELSELAFSKLARKYKSLDYRNCVLVSSRQTAKAEEPLYMVALGGFALFLSLAGWQSFALIGDMKAKIEREKRKKAVSDAAGLSALFDQSDNQTESKKPAGGTSYLEKWSSSQEP